jgi:hypothetical protein
VVLLRRIQNWQLDCIHDCMAIMRSAHLFLPLLASALLLGRRPASIVGQQWPDEAADPNFARALAPYGYPMACTRAGSTHVWRSVKIDKPKKTLTEP